MRKAGVLLHPTSLPGKLGMGDFGTCVYSFIDFISEAGFRIWQMLPLNPVNESNSPYQSDSAFAGNIWMISIEKLIEDGFLTEGELNNLDGQERLKHSYKETKRMKKELFWKAYGTFKKKHLFEWEYEQFCRENQFWLEQYSQFWALQKQFKQKCWTKWPKENKDRIRLVEKNSELIEQIEFCKFLQFEFQRQFKKVKEYANSKGIEIVCDIPIYVDPESADVWVNRELFQLNEDGNVEFVSGGTPDFFSATGQKWNGCLYQWEAHKKDQYHWWKKRFEHLLKMCDIVRIDHFNGIFRYWSVPADGVASEGHWEFGPGEDFVEQILTTVPREQIIVEDVGNVTEQAVEAIKKYQLMGMQVLENGDQDWNRKNCAFYTGTHDNNTLIGWMEDKKLTGKSRWEYIDKVMQSDSEYAIVQFQDVLGEGREARMNIPGDNGLNWEYQFEMNQLTDEVMRKMKRCIAESGR